MAEKKQGLDIGSLLQGGATVLDLMTSKKSTTKTSGGTQTQTSGLDITEEGRKKMIQDLLESNGGLAETASGQRRAGLYNSSTNQLLINDLLDRVTSSVDRDTAKTTTKTVTSPSTQQTVAPARLGLGDAALGIGGAVAAKKVYDILSSDGGILSAGGSAVEALPDFVPAFDGVGDFANFGSASGLPVVSIASNILSGKPEDALASGLGFVAGNALLPGVGGPIGAVISEILPIEGILGDIGGFFGDLFGGGSVVCTELRRQGIMSAELYANDVSYAATHISPVVLEGYRSWGVPLVSLMRRSKLVTKLVAFFAVNRAHYVASRYGTVDYSPLRAPVGAVVNLVGVPVCYVIGTVLRAAKIKLAKTAALV